MAITTQKSGQWARELSSFGRAFSGAYLFGIPLVYTMEMWWIGSTLPAWQLLTILGVAFIANLGLNYFAGFKKEAHTFINSLNDSVDALAVGAVGAFIVLVILNRINLDQSPEAMLGQIVIQTVPLSIGASVANLIFGGQGEKKSSGDNEADSGGKAKKPNPWRVVFNDLGGALAGGIFIGFSIAPTEEVVVLAAEIDYLNLLAVIGFSLLITYFIVFVSGFDSSSGEERTGLFQGPLSETALAYLLSLLVSLGALYMFNQIESGDTLLTVVTKTLVLGLPVAVGGAAGRLAI